MLYSLKKKKDYITIYDLNELYMALLSDTNFSFDIDFLKQIFHNTNLSHWNYLSKRHYQFQSHSEIIQKHLNHNVSQFYLTRSFQWTFLGLCNDTSLAEKKKPN